MLNDVFIKNDIGYTQQSTPDRIAAGVAEQKAIAATLTADASGSTQSMKRVPPATIDGSEKAVPSILTPHPMSPGFGDNKTPDVNMPQIGDTVKDENWILTIISASRQDLSANGLPQASIPLPTNL